MEPKRDLAEVVAPISGFVERKNLLELVERGVARAQRRNGRVSRERKLPARLVVMLLVFGGLLREYGLHLLLGVLGPTLRRLVGGKLDNVAQSALVQARQRLGEGPVRAVFEELSSSLVDLARSSEEWHGLKVYGVDGTTLFVTDTPDNEREFGRPTGGLKVGAFPLERLVTLTCTRLHLVVAAAMGGYCGKGQGELSLLQQLLGKLQDNAVVLLDKGFMSWPVLWRLHTGGLYRHFLLPLKKSQRVSILKVLGPGDALVQVKLSYRARKLHQEIPKTLVLRYLLYTLDGKSKTLITSMCDPKAFPAEDIIRLYSERWENELTFGELKTQMLGSGLTMRSKLPEMVRQETWAYLIAFNLLRQVMAEAAQAKGMPAIRISFKAAMLAARMLTMAAAFIGLLEKAASLKDGNPLAWLPDDLLLLPPRRTKRAFPRVVKRQVSPFQKKKANTAMSCRNLDFQLVDFLLI